MSTTQFKIDKDVPVPEDVQISKYKYPFDKLKPGYSFAFVDGEEATRNAVQAAVCDYHKKHPNKRLTVRKIKGKHHRVWRIK